MSAGGCQFLGDLPVEGDCWNGPQSRLAAGSEGFDDDHAPAAARTNIPLFVFGITVGAIGVSAPASWVWCAEQPASQCNVVGPVAIWRRGRSDGCGEIRRAGRGSESGG